MKKYLIMVLVVVIALIISFVTYKAITREDKVKTEPPKTTGVTRTTKKEVNLMDGVTINYQSSIRIERANMVIYFDPYKISEAKNDADYVFITHGHYDHYSESDIKKVMKDDTKFIVTSDVESKIKALGITEDNVMVIAPGENYVVDALKFSTIPAYNVSKNYHPKTNNWVGYNVTIDGYNYYVVGDSDVTDELKNVKCDVIFVPVGGTYTMTDEEAIKAVNEMKPKYAIPYHYGEVGSKANAENFINGLNGVTGILL